MITKANIRIGTRKSPLAMLQAKKVAKKIRQLGVKTEIIPIDSTGDINLVKPIYELGITGVFTKNLDIALLNNSIDIAVHSLKDVPTRLPQELRLSAVLKRDFEKDVCVWNPKNTKKSFKNAVIGTGSLRRTAFLKHLEPTITCVNIRGNVQTRLQKMEEEQMDGVIFSEAGLQRLSLDLDFGTIPNIISAPGQGVIAITSRKNEYLEMLQTINHLNTFTCTTIERDFLQNLEGGCTAPIGAFAYIEKEELYFNAGICSLDGTQKISIQEKVKVKKSSQIGAFWAEKAKKKGASKILDAIK